MPQSDLIAVLFLPCDGTDVSNADDRTLAGNPLRATDNVRFMGSELWSREGWLARRYNAVGLPFAHAVSLDLIYGTTSTRRHFLISQWGVLEVDTSDWSLSVPYSAEWTGTIDFTNGNATATIATKTSGAGTTVPLNGLIRALDNDGTTYTVYRVTARSAAAGNPGDTITLHRTYGGPTASGVAASIYTRPGTESDARSTIHTCTWTLFRQRVTYSAAAVWNDGATTSPYYTERSPAVTAGGLYMVVCNGVADSGEPRGPWAFRLDATAAPIFELMRQTKDSVTAATAFSGTSLPPKFCATFHDRLIVQRGDEDGENADRTIWYSSEGNMLLWHTGAVGQNATHNRIRLPGLREGMTGIRNFGDDLVVHRRRGWNLVEFTGHNVAPFRVYYFNEGLGFVSSASIVDVDGMQYGWTEYGPGVFDGSKITRLPGQIAELARGYLGTSDGAAVGDVTRSVGAYLAARQEIWWIPFGAPVFVYHVPTGHVAVNDTLPFAPFSMGILRLPGEAVMVATDAYDVVQATQTTKTKDSASTYGGAAVDVTSFFITRWVAPHRHLQSDLLKIQIELRCFPVLATRPDYVTDILQSASGTDFSYTLTVWTDSDMDAPAYSGTITIPYATYYDRRNSAETQQRPLMVKLLTIPKLRVKGELFKVKLSGTFPFRLSQMTGFFRPNQTTRRERVA